MLLRHKGETPNPNVYKNEQEVLNAFHRQLGMLKIVAAKEIVDERGATRLHIVSGGEAFENYCKKSNIPIKNLSAIHDNARRVDATTNPTKIDMSFAEIWDARLMCHSLRSAIKPERNVPEAIEAIKWLGGEVTVTSENWYKAVVDQMLRPRAQARVPEPASEGAKAVEGLKGVSDAAPPPPPKGPGGERFLF